MEYEERAEWKVGGMYVLVDVVEEARGGHARGEPVPLRQPPEEGEEVVHEAVTGVYEKNVLVEIWAVLGSR